MVKYQQPDLSIQAIENAEHLDPGTTGDNVAAKKTAGYTWDPVAQTWNRMFIGLVQQPYDYVAFSNADGNGNYQTATFKSGGSGGSTVGTLSITYDANNLMTSITRT